MKNKRFIIAVALIILSAFFSASCGCEPAPKALFVFRNGETVTNLDILAEEFEGKMIIDVLKSSAYGDTLKADIDEEGGFLNAIMDLVPNPDSENIEYISLYSTLEEYASDWGDPVTISGITYYPTNVGIAELPFVTGAQYLFSLEVYIA